MIYDDNKESFLGYIRIQTNISDSFFEDEDDEDKFHDFIADSITQEEYIVDDVPNEHITRLIFDVYDFEGDHTVTGRVRCEPALDLNDWDNVINDDDFMEYIEDTLIPKFIEWFNTTTEPIEFPVNRHDTSNVFSMMRFDGREFYSLLYKRDDGTYMNFAVRPETFKLEDNFKYEI